ncbi:MAG: ribose-5-phosphate isomerase RpiA [Thermomicrobiales bacterium]
MELRDRLQRLAATAADLIEPGMTVGLGTGSTADAVLYELGRRVAAGLTFTGVATSARTEALARELGVALAPLASVARIDLGYDGADEIDPHLDAIKGRGGALLYEKLVACSCARYVLVATTEKVVTHLGERTPLPVEIVAFGWPQTAARLRALGISPVLRRATNQPDEPFRTDNGGLILDCDTGPMSDPGQIAAAVKAVPGVVEHGLFLGLASDVLLVGEDGAIAHRQRSVR